MFVLLVRLSEPLPEDGVRTTLIFVLLLGQTLPLLLARSRPWSALAMVGAAYVAWHLTDRTLDVGNLPLAFACYGVARNSPPPASLAVTLLFPAVTVAPAAFRSPLGLPAEPELRFRPLETLVLVAVAAGLWVLGLGQRRIAADAVRLRELSDRLRAEQRVSAERAVAAERARIARDLHDQVAHHVSAIALQADATAQVVPGDAHLAGEGLASIRTAADTALTEMRGLLRLLADGTPEPRPEPSLRHLDALVRDAAATGCRVEVSMDPAALANPPMTQISAYRIVQEALTNALKHAGPASASITLRQGPCDLSITVDNAPPAPGHIPVAGSGLGLIGMRERAALLGGDLHAGPLPTGGWRVTAVLPREPG
ncbi:sensor histidine kinase [Spirillospora sp. CA-255316]